MMSILINVTIVIASLLTSTPLPAVVPPENQTFAALDPAQTAIAYSALESQGAFEELYRHLHTDAQRIIPEAAVIGWYRTEFAPQGPGIITVIGVRMVTWTWDVTGKTYSNTAEVSFTQPFANGSVATDVVRLVQDGGEWRWFFGRSREFVDQQIARYGTSAIQVPQGGPADPSIVPTTVPLDLLLSEPFLPGELPPGFAITDIGESTYGPFFGTSTDHFGATWLDVGLIAPNTGYIPQTLQIQYAVFESEAAALAAFWNPAFEAHFQSWQFGSQVVRSMAGPGGLLPSIFYWATTINSGPGLGPATATAGVSLLVGNVILIVDVSLSGFANMAGSMPSSDVAAYYAMQLADGSALHLQRLAGRG